ncbi:hypothetical protein [Xylanibacter ruminicola]|uniref:ABC-2 family transporter protein n=1 Tax=Xylanibacter ruminicola TaxID=839 RepID=A0A1M6WZG7_XYLRU|nr:hypothetical protein [Xylanibacter ruminicola]SHK99076.1 hypothetical protein SAMN05216463_11885 [Xylanibacter ruminicola]
MIQFNLCRFGKLVKWMLQGDKRYLIKSFLQVLVVMLLIFIFFTILINTTGDDPHGYKSCGIAAFAMVVVNLVLGPALMFYSMEGKHDMQALMLLPASNFEKYLVRHLNWILTLILATLAFFAADVLQYLIHLVLGHDYVRFVGSVIVNDMIGPIASSRYASEAFRPRFIASMTVLVIWFQSLYAIGATLIRTRKFSWVFTTVFIILLGFLVYKIQGYVEAIQLNDHSSAGDYAIGFGFYLVWAMINYCLSYRFFCRTQVISKFVNF